jgi:hypothetical protein
MTRLAVHPDSANRTFDPADYQRQIQAERLERCAISLAVVFLPGVDGDTDRYLAVAHSTGVIRRVRGLVFPRCYCPQARQNDIAGACMPADALM